MSTCSSYGAYGCAGLRAQDLLLTRRNAAPRTTQRSSSTDRTRRTRRASGRAGPGGGGSPGGWRRTRSRRRCRRPGTNGRGTGRSSPRPGPAGRRCYPGCRARVPRTASQCCRRSRSPRIHRPPAERRDAWVVNQVGRRPDRRDVGATGPVRGVGEAPAAVQTPTYGDLSMNFPEAMRRWRLKRPWLTAGGRPPFQRCTPRWARRSGPRTAC